MPNFIHMPDNWLCARHREPVTRQNIEQLFPRVMHELMCRDEMWEEVEAYTPGTYGEMFAKFAPICCYLGDEKMKELYTLAGIACR